MQQARRRFSTKGAFMRSTRRHFMAGSAAAILAAKAVPSIGQGAGVASLPEGIAPAEKLARVRRAQNLMASRGIGAVFIEAGPSLDYFTGVKWGRSERLTGTVIAATGDPIIVTPFFEKPSVEETLVVPAEVRTWNENEEPLKLVADFLKERGVANLPVGIEETNRYFLLDRLQQSMPGLRAVSANPVVRAMRMRKTAPEIALLQAASDITEAAIRAVRPQIRVGMSEGQVRGLLAKAMTDRGGTSPWALVLFGPAAALPHGTGKPQQLNRGDIVLIDTGCEFRGYQADISRTFVFDADPTAEQRKVWDQVSRGQQIAFAAAQIGKSAGSVDDAVRSAYTSWGYGPAYKLPGLSHRTGHGIGMEGHEPVNLVQGEETPLDVGMCFSNEPGIYLPGKFGVRMEDCFHMTAQGPRYFSQPPRSIDEPV
jgi:Xaa-Pro dipeptidase